MRGLPRHAAALLLISALFTVLTPAPADGVTVWSEPAVLNTTATSDSSDEIDEAPWIIEGSNGTLHAVWHAEILTSETKTTRFDIFYATDSGSGWSSPTTLSTDDPYGEVYNRYPQIIEGGDGALHVVWIRDYQTYYMTNPGSGWSAPVPLTTNGHCDDHPRIIEDNVGTLHAVWESSYDHGGTAGTDRDIFHATNSGSGWSEPELVNSNGASDSCYDGNPEIIEGRNGVLHVVWSGGDPVTDPEIWYSSNSGSGWSDRSLVNAYAQTDCCDNDTSPQIIEDASGTLHAVWNSTYDLGGTLDYDFHIFHATNSGSGWSWPVLLSASGAAHRILAGSDGTLHAVWRYMPEYVNRIDLFYAKKAGPFWSLPVLLHSGPQNMNPSPGNIIERSDGTLCVVWDSTHNLGGTVGEDRDIFYTIGSGRDNRNCQYMQWIPDFGGTSAPEVVRGGINFLNNRVMADVKDASSGQLIQKVFFTHSFYPISLVVIPNFTGTSAPELAMLGRRKSDGCNMADVRDASSDALIKRVYFHAEFLPYDMEWMPDFGQTSAPELATLARRPTDGTIMGSMRDASNRLLLGPRTWFHADFLPVDIEVMADIDGNGVAELVSLQQRPSDNQIISEVKDASTGALIQRVWYRNNNAYAPLDVEVMADFAGSSAPELALLHYTAETGSVEVEVRDASTGNLVNIISFDNSCWPVDIEVVPHFAYTTAPELVVLGYRSSDNSMQAELRDASSGEPLTTIYFNSSYRPYGIEVLPDCGGTTLPEIAVHEFNPDHGSVMGEVKDASNGALLQTCTFSPYFVIP